MVRCRKTMPDHLLVGGFSPPDGKICSSNWIIFPGIGVKIPKRLSCHHLVCHKSLELDPNSKTCFLREFGLMNPVVMLLLSNLNSGSSTCLELSHWLACTWDNSQIFGLKKIGSTIFQPCSPCVVKWLQEGFPLTATPQPEISTYQSNRWD